jgi:hypothetical protein
MIVAMNQAPKQILPFFISHGGEANSNTPEFDKHDWAGTTQKDGTIINPVAGLYDEGFATIMRCPSLAKGTLGDAIGSNGVFDYSFPQAFGGMPLFLLEERISWNGTDMYTPIIVEESPEYNINRQHFETAFGTGDSIGSWHDFGVKTGYTTLDGHNEIIRPMGVRYSSGGMSMNYKGELRELGKRDGLESWDRFRGQD